MIDKVKIEQCCLCKACFDSCAKGAISFTKEHKGFFYPEVDTSLCVRCGKCEDACPALSPLFEKEDGYPIAFAARSKDREIRLQSASGGVFYELARKVLEDGGYVCAAVFTADFRVKHIVTDNIKSLKDMQGSKYAQSDTAGVYKKIRQLLTDGKTVLFCGCPCQSAALRSYLKKEYENLYAVDLICHGIPSQSMLDSYIELQEESFGARAVKVSLKNKTKGWHNSQVKIVFENGKTYLKPSTVDIYMSAFYKNVSLKTHCYNCRYKGFHAGSDITLGDFWGSEVELKSIDDNTGINAALINTAKGKRLIEKTDTELIPTDYETVLKYNRQIMQSVKQSEKRNEFYAFAKKNGIKKAMQKYFCESSGGRLKREARYAVRCAYYKLRGKDKPLY